ncbi:ABC transporter permease [Brevibacillus centrosporus]|uniref:Spermidine/putrescine transport system permease protein n=1 Tax=Brevibacillus centrosporus TaxID=54910 RepID=A0A1I4BHM8_9BACL|nr:ABC transporter permease [Brevibacillus centrosporus]MEC2129760.1 ABC transporter permease [Brevibacillus centrosporus]MED4907994.1 ABC transporter permease [Brevibacillus centrosporus]RNB67177.1 ABC transporter permease [Brevibacillus centrosporus]SFK67481.1 spermidine/putrescine transport system permease protein [Brevibacillus centrosporus]GED32884.1 spermidine/putrescine ABC transporter permease [Brevibacillus centrosporus]
MKTWRRNVLSGYSWLMLVFLYLPIAILMLYSFNDSRINAVWSGFTWKWYLSLFDNRQVMAALANSMTIGIISSVLATVLGTAAALAIKHYSLRWRTFVNGLIYLPIVIPEIMMGLALLVLFSQVHMELGKGTLIMAHVTFSMPYVMVIINARLADMGKELEEAAQDLGATPWGTLRHVTLPLIMPGIVAGFLMSFTLSLDDFIISFFVAGPNSTTLPLYIYGLVKRGVSPEVNALSTMLIVCTVLLVIIAELFRRKDSKTITY